MNTKALPKKNIEDIYPLSPMQQGMLFHTLLEPGTATYNEQMYFKLRGNLNLELFKKALSTLIQRHPVLRTAFIYKKSEKLLQAVRKSVELPLMLDDWRGKSDAQQKRAFKELLNNDHKTGFNLSKAPLLRIHLLQLKNEVWQVLWSNHHIILDGWSNPILLKELFFLYEGALKNKDPQLPPTRPFKEYIVWLQKQNKDAANSYWKKLLRDVSAPTSFNIDKLPNPRHKTDRYGKKNIRLNAKDTELLKKMARRESLTINSVVQGAWSLLLHHYSRDGNIVFGATVSGRPAQIPEIQNMVGLFINTLPMRVKIDPRELTIAWLQEIQKQGVMVRDYEFSALADVQKQSAVETGPLFESILVFENYPVEEELGRQETSLTLSDFGVYEQTNFPLTLLVAADKEIIIDASYQPTRFTDQAIDDMLVHLHNLLASIGRHPQAPVGSHKLLDGETESRLLHKWNGTQANYDEQAFIPIRFEQQVVASPHQTAVIFSGQKMTYLEMNRAVNRLARELLHAGITTDQRVAIFMERSLEMVISLYAVLKAGAAYVPIDPGSPRERVRFMLEDSQPALILTQIKFQDDKNLAGARTLIVDIENLPGHNDENPGVSIAPQQAAYMIYTSGSTGRPKGTILDHRAIRNRLQWMQEAFALSGADRVLQKTPYTFDVSVWEFFWPLMYGATLVVARPEGHKDAAYLVKTIRETKITTLHFVPPMLQVFIESPEVETCRSLKKVICSGEALPLNMKERFYKKLNAGLYNLYGPTEAAVDVTWYDCPRTSPYKLLPIGMPVANTSVYILDARLQPAPIGVPGELFIGGVQVARGYHNRPGLTAEKFLPDPFGGVMGNRMYKTGDLVRRLPDGNIDYLSRLDFQLKIRGFRIELGEIESQLAALSEIRAAIVTVYEPRPGSKQLTAYVVPATTAQQPDAQNIRGVLSGALPDYMIPVHIIFLQAFPLTANGKIDRKALPKPVVNENNIDAYVAPGTFLEKEILSIWQDILSVEKIGINSNFFHLGGHSILATRLVTRFRQTFKVELPLSAMFDAPTIARQALLVEMEQAMAQRPDLPELNVIPREGPLPVSLPQQRLWFIDQFNPGTTAYNINLALRINGPLDMPLLEKSIQKVIDRHEVLRTTFINKDGAPYQLVQAAFDFKLEITENPVSKKDEKVIVRQESTAMAATVFDLEKLPLLHMKVVKFSKERFLLIGVVHHIISDGHSMSIFIQEVLTFYQGLSAGTETQLKALPFQYADYASWQRQWLSGHVLERHIAYWKKHVGLQPDVLELPTDFPRPAVQTFNGRQIDFELDESQTGRLRKFTQQNGITLFMALMTAYQILLHRYSRQKSILVGSPVTGRLLEEANALIGFFVNTLIIKGEFDQQTTFTDALLNTRRNTLDAHTHQSLPFEQLVELLQPDRDMSHPPLFQSAFILQNEQKTPSETFGLHFEEVVPESVVAKVDLSLYAIESAGCIRMRLEYNSDLFRPGSIERMARQLIHVLTDMMENPLAKIASFSIITDEERQGLLAAATRPADTLEQDTVVAAFRARCDKNPLQPALAMAKRQISYTELNKLSDKGARQLAQSGVTHDSLVGICMSRCPEMVIALLSILKSGAAYLPLDPSYPPERLHYMASDSGVRLILTNRETREHAREIFPESIKLETMESLLEEPVSDALAPLPAIHPGQLAYVIYTSGSTGKPKGTLLTHHGLVNLAHEQQKAFHINTENRILQFASLSFDAATWEIVMALLNGAALHLIDTETQANIIDLQTRIVTEAITTITLPPSALALFDDRPMPNLKTIITAGEKCPQALVKRFQPGRQMFNAYGPTETTVCACMYETSASEISDPPIGFPLGGFDLHVLDENLQIVPIGVPGELCIGGMGLALGYLNRPDLTNEKFIAHPYGPPGARLYRSGDLVRRRENGILEFLGRIDSQVKLRGFRIELGEIQSTLMDIKVIRDAFVMVREDTPSGAQLCAYLVTDGEDAPDTASIKEKLNRHLPEYMTPSAFVFLKALPLTVNGKVDAKNLPAPEMGRGRLNVEFIAPRDGQEETIAEIVKELLNIETVGIHDNFFELGGHSLLATRFVSRLRETLNIEVPLRILFEHPTIAGIIQALSGPDVRRIDSDEPELVALARDEDEADLLDAMDSLSEEELNALLNEDDNDYDE